MSNPQGPGKQRKGQNKAAQPHHQAASAPGRSEQHQPGQRAGEHGHPHGHSHSSHSSHSSKDEDEE